MECIKHIDKIMQTEQTIGNFVNTRERYSLDPYRLHADISTHKYAFAQEQILEFFNDPSMESIIYGTSSGDRRAHMLYRSDNGVIYQVHYAYGTYSDAFYLTKDFLRCIFEGNENNIPSSCGKYNNVPFVACLNTNSRSAPRERPTVIF